MHLSADVKPTNKVSLHIQLGECGPIRELLHAFAHLLVLIDVEKSERVDHRAHILVNHRDELHTELALRILRCALHKQHDLVLRRQLFQSLIQCLFYAVCWNLSCQGFSHCHLVHLGCRAKVATFDIDLRFVYALEGKQL